MNRLKLLSIGLVLCFGAVQAQENVTTTLPAVGPEGADLDTTVAALQGQLTELQNLALQAKQAHWNVSGTLFYPLHLLLQEHYEGYSKYADMVAERLLSIGVSSDGRAETIVQSADMPVISAGFVDDAYVLRFFTDELKTVGDRTRQRIKDVEDADPTSANLLQEVEAVLSQYQWQYRAHFQPTPTDNANGNELTQDNSPIYPATAPASGGETGGSETGGSESGGG